jgi:hypothetical protein
LGVSAACACCAGHHMRMARNGTPSLGGLLGVL